MLQTERLDLRPFTEADRAAMHATYSDPEVMRFVGHGPVRDESHTAALLGGYADHQRRHGFSFWAVVERETGAVIGDTGLLRDRAEVELGYTLGRAWWGRGYATEAAAAWLAHAFGPLGIAEVIALVEPANAGSLRVVEKHGMEFAGPRTAFGRPHLVFRRARNAVSHAWTVPWIRTSGPHLQ